MWKPCPGGKGKGVRKLVALYLVFYLVLLLVPPGVLLLGQDSGEAAPAQGETLSPVPAESQGPQGFLEGREPGTASQAGDFLVYDEAAGELLTVSQEEFLPGALACEMDLSAPREALKAQAVAILTLYGAKRGCGEAPLGGDFSCHTADWQVYVTREAMEQRWGEAFWENYALLQEVAQEVEGETLTYQGEAAMTPYFAISAGATVGPEQVWAQESAGAFPYLAGVASPWDAYAEGYRSSVTLTGEEFRSAAAGAFPELGLDFSGPVEEWLEVLEIAPGGYVVKAALGGAEVTGSQLRTAFGLRSAAFTVVWEGDSCTFTVTGWGHGVGMSQAGASYLASQGMGYREILAYYYPGTELTEG